MPPMYLQCFDKYPIRIKYLYMLSKRKKDICTTMSVSNPCFSYKIGQEELTYQLSIISPTSGSSVEARDKAAGSSRSHDYKHRQFLRNLSITKIFAWGKIWSFQMNLFFLIYILNNAFWSIHLSNIVLTKLLHYRILRYIFFQILRAFSKGKRTQILGIWW